MSQVRQFRIQLEQHRNMISVCMFTLLTHLCDCLFQQQDISDTVKEIVNVMTINDSPMVFVAGCRLDICTLTAEALTLMRSGAGCFHHEKLIHIICSSTNYNLFETAIEELVSISLAPFYISRLLNIFQEINFYVSKCMQIIEENCGFSKNYIIKVLDHSKKGGTYSSRALRAKVRNCMRRKNFYFRYFSKNKSCVYCKGNIQHGTPKKDFKVMPCCQNIVHKVCFDRESLKYSYSICFNCDSVFTHGKLETSQSLHSIFRARNIMKIRKNL